MLVPFLLAALLSFQLLPLPDSLLVAVAPVSGGAWKVAREGSTMAWNTISIDPGATWNGIRSAFLSASVICSAVAFGRFRTFRMMIISSLAVAGVLILGCAVCQIGYRSLVPVAPQPTDAPQHELITIASPVQTPGFGVVKVVKIGDYTYRLDRGTVAGLTGSYLYANHFAGGVCLTLPVLIACCIRLLRGQIPAIMNSSIAIGLAAFGLWSVSSFAHSRAGTVSLVVAFLVLLAALVPKGKISATFAAIAGLAFLATTSLLLLILGAFGNPAALLPARLAPLIPDVETDPRAVAARIAVRAFLASPILGTGLNTYSDVFPRFYKDGYTLFYAHNDYAQFFAECGVVGVLMWSGAAVALLVKGRQFWVAASGNYRTVNAGVWASLVGIAIHSAFDWNLHLPANGFLACLVAAMAYSSVPPSPVETAWQEQLGRLVPQRLLQLLLVASAVVTSFLFVRDAISDEMHQSLRSSILFSLVSDADTDIPSRPAPLDEATEQAQRYLRWDASNSHLLTALGQAHLHLAAQATQPSSQEQHLSTSAVYSMRARQTSAMVRGVPQRDEPVAK